MTYKAIYLDGKSSSLNYAEVSLQPHAFIIQYTRSDGTAEQVTWNISSVHKEIGFSGDKTILKFGEFPFQTLEFENRQIYQAILNTYPEEDFSSSLHTRFLGAGLKVFVGIGIGIIALALFGYFYVIPWAAEVVAKRIPIETEQEIGQSLYEQMVAGEEVDAEKTRKMQEFFNKLHYETDYKVKVTVVKDDMVNAFALPGGNIVVMTGILDKMDHYEELAGLFGHELTHVNERHVTRSLFRSLGVYFVFSMLLGDASGLSAVILENAERLKSLEFSRDLERQADKEGFDQMEHQKINPQGMVDLFNTLKSATGGVDVAEFISTHPDLDNRITEAKKRIAKEHPAFETHKDLEELFNELKK